MNQRQEQQANHDNQGESAMQKTTTSDSQAVASGGRHLGRLLAACAIGIGGIVAQQACGQGTFITNLTNGQTKNWTDATAWTLQSGSDVDGVPDGDDTVSFNQLPWAQTWT